MMGAVTSYMVAAILHFNFMGTFLTPGCSRTPELIFHVIMLTTCTDEPREIQVPLFAPRQWTERLKV